MIKPILFNGEMVKAILSGRKTVTRRVVRAAGPFYHAGDVLWVRETWRRSICDHSVYIHGECISREIYGGYQYRADNATIYQDGFLPVYNDFDLSLVENDRVWRPSIHMPKDAARIFLRVTNTHAENLWDITADGIAAEGTDMAAWDEYKTWADDKADGFPSDVPVERANLRDFFANTVWNPTCATSAAELQKYGWDANPRVVVIEFERIDKPADWPETKE